MKSNQDTTTASEVRSPLKSKIVGTLSIIACTTLAFTLLAACGGGDSKSSKDDKGGASNTAEVKLTDSPTGAMAIDLGDLKVKSGDNVVLNVTNDGTQVHNLTVEGGDATSDLAAFASATLDIGKVTEATTVFCSIQGHREAGMVATIEVAG